MGIMGGGMKVRLVTNPRARALEIEFFAHCLREQLPSEPIHRCAHRLLLTRLSPEYTQAKMAELMGVGPNAMNAHLKGFGLQRKQLKEANNG